MVISKSQIITKYWRNTANYEIYIRYNLLKLPACGFVVPKTTPIDDEYDIQHSHVIFLIPDCSSSSRHVSCK